jgi:dTDP-4-dehydrorhamnose reductase
MIVALLGANGQLGSDIVRAAAAMRSGIEILGLTRKDLDVTDVTAIPATLSARKFDVLVNCTGYHKTDEVEGRAAEAFQINVQAVLAMTKVCKAQSARFVHISTDYVFDGESKQPYREEDAAEPVNVYGSSKLLGEKLAMREYPSGTIVARVASLFGVAGSSGKGGNFVETILRKAKESGEVRVVNDITMSPTSTADAANVILALVKGEPPAGLYHVVNSGSASWFEFAREMVQAAGIAANVVPTASADYPTAAARPRYSVLANGKVSSITGEIAHWKDALRRYLSEKGYIPFDQARAVAARE